MATESAESPLFLKFADRIADDIADISRGTIYNVCVHCVGIAVCSQQLMSVTYCSLVPHIGISTYITRSPPLGSELLAGCPAD
jgi:hypothetical protein